MERAADIAKLFFIICAYSEHCVQTENHHLRLMGSPYISMKIMAIRWNFQDGRKRAMCMKRKRNTYNRGSR